MKFVLLFTFFHSSVALNVVFYVLLLGKSHIDYIDSLIDTLVERGHDVDLIIARMNSHVKANGSEKVTRRFVFGFEKDSPWSKTPHLLNPFQQTSRSFSNYKHYSGIATEVCRIGLSNPLLHDFITSKKYDIGLATEYDYCPFALFKHYKIPSIASITSMAMLDQQSVNAGLPNSPAVTHSLFHVEDLNSIVGRFWNLAVWTHINYVIIPYFARLESEVIHKYLSPEIDVHEVIRNTDLIFLNSNEIIERPRPISHKIKYIGGINTNKPRKLEGMVRRIVEESKEGVVVFSFGTQVNPSSFPHEIKKSFADAFEHFPNHTFIWKYELQPGDEKIFKNSTNLHVMKWLPQTDLLYHRQTKAFISHTGLNSYMEASYAGVPILAVPLFVDQRHNAFSGKDLGTTYVLDKTHVNKDTLIEGLGAVLRDESYTQNAKRIAKMLETRPHPPKSQFIEWIEYLGENPLLHRQLNQPGGELSPFYYYCLDVIFLSSFLLVSSLFVTYKFLRVVLSFSVKKLKVE